jgi:F-type H+-transporting ATPase subunit b
MTIFGTGSDLGHRQVPDSQKSGKFGLIWWLAFCLCFLLPGTPATWAEQPLAEALPVSGEHATTTSAAPAGHAGPGLFDINIGILVSQTLNFLLLLFILKRFLFTPIRHTLEQREQHIGQRLLDAEKAKKQAEILRLAYEEHIAIVDEETYNLRQKAINEGKAAREEILTQAHEQAAALVVRTKRDLEIEYQKAWAHLRQEMVKLTMHAAERVVEQSLDDNLHRHLIEHTIDELERSIHGGEQ